MKIQYAILFAAAVALPAFAHDPSLHKPGEAKDPDCEQMEHMDMSKMDAKDPVMKAMHDKCMAAMKHGHDQKPAAAQDKSKADKSDAHSHDNHDAK